MHIQRLTSVDAIGHKEVDIRFPSNGIVVVTGSNGSGKSSIIEVVSSAFWGKTVRGTQWHVDGVKQSRVAVWSDALSVERTREGSKQMVRVALPMRDLLEYPTLAKAQETIDSTIEDMTVWQRSSVFSSQDFVSFSVATDAERKRLIESILGLDKFDFGLAACRKELAQAKKDLLAIESVAKQEVVRLRGYTARLSDARELLGEEPQRVDEERFQERAQRLGKLTQQLGQGRIERADCTRRIGELTKRISTLEAELKASESISECPICKSVLTLEVKRKLYKKKLDELEKAEQAIPELQARAKEILEQEATMKEQQERANKEVEHWKRIKHEHSSWEQRRAKTLIKVGEVKAEKTLVEKKLAELQTELAGHIKTVAELEVVEQVLGLRGVRALILGRALEGLEACVTSWLSRFLHNATIRLAPETDGSSGPMQRICLSVEGLGSDSRAYKACSGGERRRIDVAFLLGLAEMSAAAAGRSPGTLFFDEVFDTLDPGGISTIAEALLEVSQDRCVVVITHSEALAEELTSAYKIEMQAGRVIRAG
jgi:DNA repair exonuclease SbcCD ATPase subunit